MPRITSAALPVNAQKRTSPPARRAISLTTQPENLAVGLVSPQGDFSKGVPLFRAPIERGRRRHDGRHCDLIEVVEVGETVVVEVIRHHASSHASKSLQPSSHSVGSMKGGGGSAGFSGGHHFRFGTSLPVAYRFSLLV
jgi:hypothetical protein